MEKPPQFIRTFSKEEFPEERQKVAHDIRAKRAEHFEKQRVAKQQKEEVESTITKHEQTLAEQLEQIHTLEEKIADISQSRLTQLLHYFEIKKLRADLVGGQKAYDELKAELDTILDQTQEISKKTDTIEAPVELQAAKQMLDNFYIDQKTQWSKSEYTKEDITSNFSEEHLASLSIEDYALLLKRFPGEMVAHVTRQGIRDHLGHMFHTAGEGEYFDGFMKITKDGRLRAPLGVYLAEEEKDKAIEQFLDLNRFKSNEEATEYLDKFTKVQQGDPGSYVDRMAIHFATEEVADAYYGSEKGNEIFITYPSAHVASQYYFNADLKSGGGGYWNDQWVWANEERGMDLNAGLVFIPEAAQVDKTTGSRYELDENKNPIKNEEYIRSFKAVVESPDFEEFAQQASNISGKLNQQWDDPDLIYENIKILNELEPFRERLEKEFQINDKRLQFTILMYNTLRNLASALKEEDETKAVYLIDSSIEAALQKSGILYNEARDPIPSKEFWETYFTQHPEQKPSKIVYYEGIDPTAALQKWKKDHGIHKKADDMNIGYGERRIARDAPQATAGLDRFKSIAEKVISDHLFSNENIHSEIV